MSESWLDLGELLEGRKSSESRYNALISRYEDLNSLYEIEEKIQALRMCITNDSIRPEDVESLAEAAKARKILEAKIMFKHE